MVGEVGTGTGERVHGMGNGTYFTQGPFAGPGASGGGRIMGVEIGVNNELMDVGRFEKSDRGKFGEEVLG